MVRLKNIMQGCVESTAVDLSTDVLELKVTLMRVVPADIQSYTGLPRIGWWQNSAWTTQQTKGGSALHSAN